MNWILTVYFGLPHDRTFGIFSKAINRVIAKVLKRILDVYVPWYFKRTKSTENLLNTEKRDIPVVISLTSFPGRINDLWIVIECLFRQTYKADRVILWLSKEQFENEELPLELLEQKKQGLEVVFVDDDIRSHKKYFYCLQKYPDSIMITVDDDVFYHKDVISELIKGFNEHPDCVIANRAHEILFDDKGKILPYRRWKLNKVSNEPSFMYVPTGVGGILYPPGAINKAILEEKLLKMLCFSADDLWLRVGALLNNKKVFITKNFKQEFITVGKTQKVKLVTGNSLNGGNDLQFLNTLSHFKLENLDRYKTANNL